MITTPATDGDSTYPNNDIIYRIDTGAKDKFGMDAGTGRITVTNGADLDRDVYGTRYTLTVSEKIVICLNILAFPQLKCLFVHLETNRVFVVMLQCYPLSTCNVSTV